MDCAENNHLSPEENVDLQPKSTPQVIMVDKSTSPDKSENLKRKITFHDQGNECPPLKEPKLSASDITSRVKVQKNALCILHELYRGLNVKIIDQKGPVNSPIFTASIEINGFIFQGKGKNKKLAKHSAAEAALRSLVQVKNPYEEGPILYKSQNADFSDDPLYKDINDYDVGIASASNSQMPNGECVGNGKGHEQVENLDHGRVSCRMVTSIRANGTRVSDKNPVMLLNELYPNAKYELISESGDQASKYTMAVYIDDQRFEGQGSSKKLSKAAAARSALSLFYNVIVPDTPMVPEENLIPEDSSSLPQKFADHVAKLVKDKFDCLIPKCSVHYRKKVLAGFVVSQQYELSSCKVITISTGTKCINGERMSVNGSVLNDSHAEIISRRCLCSYFYSELEKLSDKDLASDSIFKPKTGGGFKLKDGYKFHLFINTAPCGDSRIFSPYDIKVTDRHPNRKARGQMRTKIECGEGTIPVKSSDGMQTWDGVLLGERLLTMSCSDKIAKWNIVGIQGALLSNYIEPIYIDSIILGSLFHPHHLYRAVCGRIEKNIIGLPPPYRLSKPRLSGTVNTEKRQVGKAPFFSVNWIYGDDSIEVVNAVNGRTDENKISRLSKCKLFYKFLKLLEKIPTTTGLEKLQGPLLYSQCKEAARDFQVSKKELFKSMSRGGLGDWVKKPLEVDQFEWDVDSLTSLFNLDDIENPSVGALDGNAKEE